MATDARDMARIVREADPDRYLSLLYAPEDRRPALAALYAFNVEIASVRDRVREPLAGEMRMQWWRDAIEGGGEAAAGHPVAEALVATIAAHRLPLEPFRNMVEARVFDLYDDPMPSRTDLEGYCGETASALIQLAALVLSPGEAVTRAGAAGHAGCAQAITGLMRLVPLHRARGQCYLPADLLAAAGLTAEAFVAGTDREGSARALAAMQALAREHLAAFETEARGMPAILRPAFLPVALTGAYLDRLAREGASASQGFADISPLRRHWLLLRHALRGWG